MLGQIIHTPAWGTAFPVPVHEADRLHFRPFACGTAQRIHNYPDRLQRELDQIKIGSGERPLAATGRLNKGILTSAASRRRLDAVVMPRMLQAIWATPINPVAHHRPAL